MLHISLHFLVPALLAGLFYRARWRHAFLLLIATMAVDIDNLWASPIYDSDRCSIGFHLLHQPWFITLYLALALIPKTRLIGVGCLVHMALDGLDCFNSIV